MGYDVSFWRHEKYGVVQIHSFNDPFIEGEVDESIYMDSNDFFNMVEKYAAINLFREAWQKVKENIHDEKSLEIINKVQSEFEDYNIDFNRTNQT